QRPARPDELSHVLSEPRARLFRDQPGKQVLEDIAARGEPQGVERSGYARRPHIASAGNSVKHRTTSKPERVRQGLSVGFLALYRSILGLEHLNLERALEIIIGVRMPGPR